MQGFLITLRKIISSFWCIISYPLRPIGDLFDLLYSYYKKLFEDNILKKVLFWALVTASFAIIIVLSIDLYFLWKTNSTDTKPSMSLGEFGDFFGGTLNPVFTFLTFLGLIITIVVQQQELKLARTEFRKTADTLKTQEIENTLFNILNLHHKIVQDLCLDISKLNSIPLSNFLTHTRLLTIPNLSDIISDDEDHENHDDHENHEGLEELLLSSTTKKAGLELRNNEQLLIRGRDVFAAVINYLSIECGNDAIKTMKKFKQLQVFHNHILGHYFRNLYQALKLVESHEKTISEKQQRRYTNLIRAQLSTNELILLLFNCLDKVVDDGQFKNLLVKYRMLEHLPLKQTDNGVLIKGFDIHVSNDMLLQYKSASKINETVRKDWGAFGKNPGIPAHLLL